LAQLRIDLHDAPQVLYGHLEHLAVGAHLAVHEARPTREEVRLAGEVASLVDRDELRRAPAARGHLELAFEDHHEAPRALAFFVPPRAGFDGGGRAEGANALDLIRRELRKEALALLREVDGGLHGCWSSVDEVVIDVAPPPILTGLQGLDDGMLHRVE